MEHPQEISLLVSHLESLFNILESQYLQLASLPSLERGQTKTLREKIKGQMKEIVNVLEDLNDCYLYGKRFSNIFNVFIMFLILSFLELFLLYLENWFEK